MVESYKRLYYTFIRETQIFNTYFKKVLRWLGVLDFLILVVDDNFY